MGILHCAFNFSMFLRGVCSFSFLICAHARGQEVVRRLSSEGMRKQRNWGKDDLILSGVSATCEAGQLSANSVSLLQYFWVRCVMGWVLRAGFFC